MTPDPRGNDSVALSDADAGPLGRGPTRRQAIALAGGTAAAAGMALGPFSSFFAGAAQGDGPPEITLTGWLMGLELAAVELYGPLADNGTFDAASQQLVATCAGHHTDQSAALGEMVTAGGGESTSDPNQAFVEEFRGRVDGAGDGAAKATVLAEMENGFAATYEAALATITSPSLAAVVAQILSTDAAQAVAWSAAANGQGSEAPLPTPDAIPASQSDEGQFTQTAFTPNTTTPVAPEASTAGGSTTVDESTSLPGTTMGDAS